MSLETSVIVIIHYCSITIVHYTIIGTLGEIWVGLQSIRQYCVNVQSPYCDNWAMGTQWMSCPEEIHTEVFRGEGHTVYNWLWNGSWKHVSALSEEVAPTWVEDTWEFSQLFFKLQLFLQFGWKFKFQKKKLTLGILLWIIFQRKSIFTELDYGHYV
jgi:hypothetical protein